MFGKKTSIFVFPNKATSFKYGDRVQRWYCFVRNIIQIQSHASNTCLDKKDICNQIISYLLLQSMCVRVLWLNI